MDSIVSQLNRDELDHVMQVLSRDRELRDQEQERIVRMRQDLIREKRMGALVVGRKYSANPDSRCGRCQNPLDLVDKLDRQKARCFICKHLVCKRCRIMSWRSQWEQGKQLLVDDERGRRRTTSAPVDPISLLPPPSTRSSRQRNKAPPRRKAATLRQDAVTQTDITWVNQIMTGADSLQCPSCGRGSSNTSKSVSSIDSSPISRRASAKSDASPARRTRKVRSKPPSPSSSLLTTTRSKPRASTFSAPGDVRVPTDLTLRERRHSSTPPPEQKRRNSNEGVELAVKASASIAKVFAFMPQKSDQQKDVKSSPDKLDTKKVDPNSSLNPFEEGYVDPPTPSPKKIKKERRESPSDHLNPFLVDEESEQTPPNSRSNKEETEGDYKVSDPPTSSTKNPPEPKFSTAPPTAGAARFLMLAGVTPPRDRINNVPSAPRTIPSKQTFSLRRKLDFGSTPNATQNGSPDFVKRITSENLLSSSFSDLRSSLKFSSFSSFSFLNKSDDKEVGKQNQKTEQVNGQNNEESDTKTETESTTESASENLVTGITDDSGKKSGNATVTATTDEDSVDELDPEEWKEDKEVKEEIEKEDEDEITCTEASDEESEEEELEEQTPVKAPLKTDVSYLRTASPFHNLVGRSPGKPTPERSLSDSIMSTTPLAAISLELGNDSISSAEEELAVHMEVSEEEQSDVDTDEDEYVSENSGSEDGDLDDSDGSPSRSEAQELNFQSSVEQAEPLQRKGTRDSGYMTPDELSRLRRSPSQKATRAFGAVERRAVSRKTTEELLSKPLVRANSVESIPRASYYEPRRPPYRRPSHAEKSDAESVKSESSASSLPAFSALTRTLPNFSWSRASQRPSFPAKEPEWICRVCYKTLEMHKKTGDWFRFASKSPAVPPYIPRAQGLSRSDSSRSRAKEHPLTPHPPSQPVGNHVSSTRPVNGKPHRRTAVNKVPELKQPQTAIPLPEPSLVTVSNAKQQNHVSQSVKPTSSLSSAKETQKVESNRKTPPSAIAESATYQALSAEAAKKNWVNPRSKEPELPEKIMSEIEKIVPDLAASSQGSIKFTKKKSSLPGSMIKPAEITHGPQDITVIRGNPISLCCQLKGSPPLRVVWRKGKDEIKHSKQCNIESTQISSALTIAKSERDDSGCYTLQVKNGGGVDQFSVSVKVVDVPDPPGKPFAESVRGDDIVVSWYGSGYDGGSPIKSYVLESCKVWDNGGGRKTWTEVATTNSTSHTVHGLERNAAYMFRVSAQNAYGVSKSGPASDIVRNVLPAMENGADSSEDEDESDFVKYEPVAIRQNEKFQNKYEIHEKLGQGRFGKVHRVTDRASGLHYAAKIMRALKVKDKEAVSLEIEIMNKLRHPKLVQLIDAYSHGREVVMVMDLVAGGELFERVIDEDFELTEAACIKYMRQICAGVQFMHTSNIVHLDLKPENIMCINKTGTQIKLIDFGLARKFNPNETIRVMFGTPEFVAPEVINYDAIGYQTDMWSVGVICYILLSGLSPFSGDADSETLSNITAVQWDFEDEAFDQISLDAKDFISKLLVKSLKSRYTVDKALAHKWLKKDTKKMSKSKLNTKNLKRFLARRKWQKTGNAVRALSRLASLARLTPSSNNTGSQRESGFLSALKAQLVRERESEQAPDRRKPEFVQPFDDVEVIVGSAAKFECTVTGVPDPEIIWYKDERPIKESRHFRISYTEDDVCTLLITEATPQDEAEYTCKAMNSEGTVEHRAELIVISPGV